MYCMVERRVLPSLTEEEREHLLTQAHLHTLLEMLEAIPDPPSANTAYALICRICSPV